MAVHDQLVYAVSMVLRDRRELLSISQSDLARKSGLHRSYIGDLERGSRNLSLKNLSRLSTALDLVPSKLLSLAEKKIATDGPVKALKLRPRAVAVKPALPIKKGTTKTAPAKKTPAGKKVDSVAKPVKAVAKVSTVKKAVKKTEAKTTKRK